MRILLAEDETDYQRIMTEMIANYKNQTSLDYILDCINDARLLRDKILYGNYDLLLLDIEMKPINTLEFIQSFKHTPPIIFITSHYDLAHHAFDLGVIDYIVKPFSAERFYKALERFQHARQSGLDKIVLDFKNQKLILAKKEIIYISAQRKHSMIYTTNEEYDVPYTLLELENLLTGGIFQRIHRSYIANIRYARTLRHEGTGYYTLILNDAGDTPIPVGRQFSSLLKKRIASIVESQL